MWLSLRTSRNHFKGKWKMKKRLAIFFLLISSTALQGCNNLKTTNATPPIENTNENTNSDQLLFLKHCLNNANELVNLNKKYKSDYNEIHSLITEAKYYSSFSDKTSENITKTITPLFEYKINYKCNNITNLLIEEFKNRAQKTESLGGNIS